MRRELQTFCEFNWKNILLAKRVGTNIGRATAKTYNGDRTEPSKCHSNFVLNFFCLDFFLAFKFFPDFFLDFLLNFFPDFFLDFFPDFFLDVFLDFFPDFFPDFFLDFFPEYFLDFFLDFSSRLFFPPLITYACVNGSFRHVGNRNNHSFHVKWVNYHFLVSMASFGDSNCFPIIISLKNT